MRYAITFGFLIFLGAGQCHAQKNDYIWLSGYESNDRLNPDTVGYQWGNNKLNFNYNPMQLHYDSLGMNFDFTSTTISDTDGNLLFYTNGIYIANWSDETVENGDSLNAGYVIYVWDPTIALDGYRLPQGLIALSDISNSNQYYLFHTFIDTLSGTNAIGLYYAQTLVTLVDMSMNGGLGDVLYKNQTLIQDSLGAEIQAVKHGNGRDWWLLVQKRNTNCYYEILLDSTGPHVMPDLQCLGPVMPNEQIGADCFSPDGGKFVYLCSNIGLTVYDFDRCTGILSNAQFFALPTVKDSGWSALGVAISPNSRYLYASVSYQLYQFDLWNADIFSTIDTVGLYDGGHFPGVPEIQNEFYTQQLAPDGKIYMSCGNTTNVYHVINAPDEPDTACNFVQGGVVLAALADGLPNYPNYRLGALTQSQCDSLSGLNEVQRAAKEQIIKVFPNPANTFTVVDYGFTDWNKAQPNLEICNALGQALFTQILPMYSGFQKIDISSFANGIYSVYIKRKGAVIASAKLVKE